MPTINITNITQQDVVRNTDFNITKEFTITLDTGQTSQVFNSVIYDGNSSNDNIQVTLEVDGSAASFPVTITASSSLKLRLQGRYDELYNQDSISFVPGGQSDKIVQPTIVTGFSNVPNDADLINVAQDPRDNLDVTHTLRFVYDVFNTISVSFVHEDVRTDNEGFRKAIQQHCARRLTRFENTAPLAFGKGKLLGNITDGNLNTITNTGEFPTTFTNYWNTALAGNVCKWRPVESTRGTFDFSGADVLHSFCIQNGIKMIWHTLLWGQNQGHPSWFVGLSEEESKAAVKTWFKAIADRYGDDIYGIQVLNEITPGHQTKTETVLKPQLGGEGTTGFDWIIWVYEQARFYFPNALLWTNDFNLLSNNAGSADDRRFMYSVSKVLSDRGLVDAFGMQSHYFNINDLTTLEVTNILNEVQRETDVPIHITEFDISGSKEQQLERYQRIFPAIWNHPRVERVNLWGWIFGETWRHDQGHATGLINRDGTDKRPALTWLESFIEDGITTTSESLANQLLLKDNLIINIDAENSYSYSGSGTAITDLQGNANATLENAVFNNTIPKNWQLDESGVHDSFITFGDIETFNAPQDFTFSIWLEFTAFDGDSDIFTKGSHNQNKPILVWYDEAVNGTLPEFGGGNTNTISFMVTDTDGVDHWIAAPSNSIVANQVYNIVVQKESNTGQSRIWINGVVKADHTKSTTDGIGNSTAPLKIGAATGTTGTQDSDMKIYAFHAYDSFLTDAEITRNWNALRNRFGNVLNYFTVQIKFFHSTSLSSGRTATFNINDGTQSVSQVIGPTAIVGSENVTSPVYVTHDIGAMTTTNEISVSFSDLGLASGDDVISNTIELEPGSAGSFGTVNGASQEEEKTGTFNLLWDGTQGGVIKVNFKVVKD